MDEYSKIKPDGSLEYYRDKAEGLACDLDSAIEVMAKRVWGGADLASMGIWLSLNYGKHKAVTEARRPLSDAIARDARIVGLKEALEIVQNEPITMAVSRLSAAISARISQLEQDSNV